jgi:hypothetical protein
MISTTWLRTSLGVWALAMAGCTSSLVVHTVGSGTGSLASQPSGIESPCFPPATPPLSERIRGYRSAGVAQGTQVRVEATPTPGSSGLSTFGGWLGCAASLDFFCVETMNTDQTVFARFAPQAAGGFAGDPLGVVSAAPLLRVHRLLN